VNAIETVPTQSWHPVTEAERYFALDALRGFALLGVLLVNLLSDFRISLAEHILNFHTQPGWADRAVDVLAAGLLEFKAFAVFSLLFGVGLAVVAERAEARHVNVSHFLARRLLILLAIGLCHFLLIWNGDILSLYAVCGLALLPLIRMPVAVLATAGTTAVVLTFVIPWGFLWPAEDTLRGLASEAARVYSNGGVAKILAFHWRETQLLILPLLAVSVPKTWGLMALGAATWRGGVSKEPQRHGRLLWGTVLVGGLLGGLMTTLSVYSASTGRSTIVPALLVESGSYLPLALAYAAGLLLVLQSPRATRLTAPFAAAGRMALTNYLAQSAILGWLFYGYGLNLFGRLGSAAAAAIGIGLYSVQLAFSRAWLRRFRFGPVEWLWRSITYGDWLPMRRDA
jgi:uncharacterized protein